MKNERFTLTLHVEPSSLCHTNYECRLLWFFDRLGSTTRSTVVGYNIQVWVKINMKMWKLSRFSRLSSVSDSLLKWKNQVVLYLFLHRVSPIDNRILPMAHGRRTTRWGGIWRKCTTLTFKRCCCERRDSYFFSKRCGPIRNEERMKSRKPIASWFPTR